MLCRTWFCISISRYLKKNLPEDCVTTYCNPFGNPASPSPGLWCVCCIKGQNGPGKAIGLGPPPWVHLGSIWGSFGDHLEVILVTFWGHLESWGLQGHLDKWVFKSVVIYNKNVHEWPYGLDETLAKLKNIYFYITYERARNRQWGVTPTPPYIRNVRTPQCKHCLENNHSCFNYSYNHSCFNYSYSHSCFNYSYNHSCFNYSYNRKLFQL